MTTTTTAFTPGPWRAVKVVKDQSSLGDRAIYDSFDRRIANVYAVASDVPTDNARLIAAAPDLLAVCQEIATRYNHDDRLGGLGDMLADAIAKATGA